MNDNFNQGQHQGSQLRTPPDNNLVGAILTTVCCCLPFGIVSIVFAAQVNTKFQAGDLEGALQAASKSRLWMWWGIGIGLAGGVLYGLLMFAGAAAALPA